MKRLFLLLAAVCLCALASAQEIRDIRTEVYLYTDGDALVLQTWDINVTEGTEWYIPIDNPGKCNITYFHVYENDEPFFNEGDDWDSNRSIGAKAQRCGIVRKKGGNLELCWGLGSLGDHQFTILYAIEHLVQSYPECDGFHWHFLNDEWSVRPKHASIYIMSEEDKGPKTPWYWKDEEDNNVRFWGFGMIGTSELKDGALCFESTEPFRYQSFFSALVSFDKVIFQPTVEGDGTFEALQKEAFEGSDYGKDDDDFEEFLGKVIGICFLLIPVIIVLTVIFLIVRRIYWKVSGKHYKKKVFGEAKIDGWWREIPMEGNPTGLFSLIQEGDHLAKESKKTFPNLVSAYFLKWIQEGLLRVERDPKKTDRVNLLFVKGQEEIPFDDGMEATVYRAAREAAGENLILEANEFKEWSFKNDTTVVGWPMEAVYSGRARWQPLSLEDRRHAIEFKNFLNDFTLVDQREAPEVGLWKHYMVLAAALGIADKVAKNFAKLFPKIMEEYSRESNMMDMVTTYMILDSLHTSSYAMMSSAIRRQEQREAAAAQARRSAGGGGSISFGGGHGGFGGGHGGGAR